MTQVVEWESGLATKIMGQALRHCSYRSLGLGCRECLKEHELGLRHPGLLSVCLVHKRLGIFTRRQKAIHFVTVGFNGRHGVGSYSFGRATRRSPIFSIRKISWAWPTLWKREKPNKQAGGDDVAGATPIAGSSRTRVSEKVAEAAAMIHIVSYRLNPKRDATSIIAGLQQSSGWAHYMDDVWFIATHESATQLHNRIVKLFQRADWFFVAELSPSAQYQGWMPKPLWDWIIDTRNRGY